jgi:hypothetical protein
VIVVSEVDVYVEVISGVEETDSEPVIGRVPEVAVETLLNKVPKEQGVQVHSAVYDSVTVTVDRQDEPHTVSVTVVVKARGP